MKSDLFKPDAGMIFPDSAKIVVALRHVPGQMGSGEMDVDNGITEYAIDIIPNGKKTHAKSNRRREHGRRTLVQAIRRPARSRGLGAREQGHKTNTVKLTRHRLR